jgi:tripartite-type tricarboxylate transporter receptor subunit TctC
MMAPILGAVPMVQDGRLRALAVTGRHPAPAVPELPTISGTLPGFSALSWYGILAPAGTPSTVITRLNTELDRIVHEPQIEKRFAAIGGEAIGGPPSTLASLIHDEIARWRRVAKEAGIHIE